MRFAVVDASALIEYLLGTTRGSRFAAVLQVGDVDLHAPALCDVEVASGVVRLLTRKLITNEGAGELLDNFIDLPITRHRHLSLLARAISLRHNFTVYDGVYIALAESLGATLVTGDQRLATAARRHTSLDVVSG